MSFPDPQARIASLERELAWAHLKIQSLVEELRRFRVKMLGPKSETLNDLQLELLADQEPGATLDEVEAESERAPLTVAPPRERKPHPGRQRLPEHLERVEEVVPCAEQTCRQCGAETAVIGYDESEQLDVVPARYFVVVLRGIFLKGVGVAVLWTQGLAMVAYAVVGLALAAHAFRKEIA